MDVREAVLSLGGLAQKQQLVALGARDLDLTRAVRDGSVARARQGWYTTIGEQEPCIRAVRVGGRLTGISAIRYLGGWVERSPRLHVSVPSNAARLRSATNWRVSFRPRESVTLHWDSVDLSDRGTNLCVSLADALLRVVLDENLETAVAALDWALHTGRMDEFDFELLILALPENRRWIRYWVDAKCESLPESQSRTRLRLAGHRVTSQVPLGESRIDLVVDDIVGLEVDGEEFHLHRFEEDRTKDMQITMAGFHAIRPTAKMVFHEWDWVLSGIERAIAARTAFGNSGETPRGAQQAATTGHSRRLTPEFPKVHAELPPWRGRRGRKRGNTAAPNALAPW